MFKKLSSKSQAPFLFLKAKFDKSSVRTEDPTLRGPCDLLTSFWLEIVNWTPLFEPFKVPPREWVGGGVGTATMVAATGF